MNKIFKNPTSLILVILLCVSILVGCTGEVTYLDIGFIREGNTWPNIGDGMFICAAWSNTNVFDESNVMFSFYFGYRFIPDPSTDIIAIVVAFFDNRSVIYAEEHDDYRNIPDFYIAREFTVNEFFSKKYAVEFGEYTKGAYSHYEKFIVPQKIYMTPNQNFNVFYFAVLSVRFNAETGKYNFFNEYYSLYHLIAIHYKKLDNGKFKLSNNERPDL
ncbi:MAG: hypothetical protein LBE09_03200 [Christensenellaceae bacterium]|jgi:hypothetical protein|nr:hypothetical protein [Christensenellaceae bacterium]